MVIITVWVGDSKLMEMPIVCWTKLAHNNKANSGLMIFFRLPVNQTLCERSIVPLFCFILVITLSDSEDVCGLCARVCAHHRKQVFLCTGSDFHSV